MTWRLIWTSSVLCLCLYDCGGANSRFEPRKPDPTKGTVTGSVICNDTGKPARFAQVTLLPDSNAGKRDEEQTVTDLDGRFKIEAVAPGRYFAFATLTGYLDPEYGLDFDSISSEDQGGDPMADIVAQWKEHLAEVTVNPQQVSDVSIEIERGAEITGTVAYDDGSPAIGARFAMYRRNEGRGWLHVGEVRSGKFALPAESDSRGHFDVTNLPGGTYVVCAVVPGDDQESSPQICLGDVFRMRDARAVEVSAGESVNGGDIVIPLKAIHSVGGRLVQAAADGPPIKATLRLLYADDREVAMSISTFSDGTFLFPFVPEASFILQVTDAKYTEQIPATESAKATTRVHEFAPREISVSVDKDVSDLAVALAELLPKKAPHP